MFSRHADFINASIFLSLWKAITAIVGDPGERDYQSRYKQLGFDHAYFMNEITHLKTIRDRYDVAHHHLSPEAIDEVRAERQRAVNVAREAISRYRNLLANPEAEPLGSH